VTSPTDDFRRPTQQLAFQISQTSTTFSPRDAAKIHVHLPRSDFKEGLSRNSDLGQPSTYTEHRQSVGSEESKVK
jgi:hypothetical protein